MNHATIGDAARFYFPAATPEEIQSLVWECTAFPITEDQWIMSQIEEWSHKANTVDQACYLADGETSRIMGEIRRSK